MGLQYCLSYEIYACPATAFNSPPSLPRIAVMANMLYALGRFVPGTGNVSRPGAMPCCVAPCTFLNFGKHCIHRYNVFDFLREVVSKVPDYGGADAGGDLSKRRKVAGVEVHESDEDSKRSRMDMCHGTSSVRGRGRGRPRGRGRGLRLAEREPPQNDLEVEPCTSEQRNKQLFSPGRPAENISESPIESLSVVGGTDPVVGTFDLNTGIDDTANETTTTAATSAVAAVTTDAKADECQEISEVDRMVIDPLQVAQMNSQLDDDEEDYDEEG